MQRLTILGLLLAGLAMLANTPAVAADREPVKLIFDTDIDSDCDDAGAIAILHALADAGEVEILATMVSSPYVYAAPCMEVLNRYYGRPDLPIGCPKGKMAVNRGSKYAKKIAEEYPATLKTNADAPDAAKLYRKILAAQPDGQVVIVSVGDLTNLRDLLATRPDEHSPLAGPELIRKKVKHYVCMGGRYPSHLDPAVFGNFKTDPDSAVAVARDWPTTLYFTGLGDDVQTGKLLRQTDPKNPVRRIYELYLGKSETRPSWDPIATLFAIQGQGEFFDLRTQGCNHIFPNGTNEWRDEPDSPTHVLLEWKPGGAEKCREAMDELMARPPKAKAAP